MIRSTLVACLLVACSFPDKTTSLVCATTADCDDGRSCVRGYCAVATSLDGDVPGDDADPPSDGPPIDTTTPLACDATNFTCASGTPVATTCGGHCWIGCTELVAQPVAIARCTAWGGNAEVTPLRDLTVDTACARAEVPTGQRLWLGLVQAPNQGSVSTGWAWGAGDPLLAPNWMPAAPDDSDDTENNEENCAFVSESGPKWNDKVCTTPYAFTCRR